MSRIVSHYEVTKEGQIISHSISGKQMVLSTSQSTKYKMVSLYLNGVTVNKYVHRLVAEQYCERPEGCNEVDHIDGDKFNNHADNLEWVTRAENMSRAYDANLIDCRGTNSALSKTNESDVIEMRRLWDLREMKQGELSEMFNISRTQVSAIVNRKQWKHI
tara:strand:- start:30 stop:512 length:483 start_codon:yes stop_codon:yes gene_type:complete